MPYTCIDNSLGLSPPTCDVSSKDKQTHMYKYRAKAWKNKCKTWFVTHTGYVWGKTLEMFPTLREIHYLRFEINFEDLIEFLNISCFENLLEIFMWFPLY